MRNLVGGVMTPPYEKCIFNCDKLLQWRCENCALLRQQLLFYVLKAQTGDGVGEAFTGDALVPE